MTTWNYGKTITNGGLNVFSISISHPNLSSPLQNKVKLRAGELSFEWSLKNGVRTVENPHRDDQSGCGR